MGTVIVTGLGEARIGPFEGRGLGVPRPAPPLSAYR
jgi:hypothetical protein